MSATTGATPRRKDTTPLFRDPGDWARDWGWVSRRRALRAAARLNAVADAMRGALGDDGVCEWADELDAVAKYLAPARVPAERKRGHREEAS